MESSGEPSASAPASADHGSALAEGQRFARAIGRSAGSADVLLGLLRAGGAAARVLGERGVVAARLEPVLPHLRVEPRFDVEGLARVSQEIATTLGARQTSSLHLLLALLRGGGSAVEMLRLAGFDPGTVRALVLRALTGPGPVVERTAPRPTGLSALPLIVPRARPPAQAAVPAAEPAPPPPEPTPAETWELVPLEPPRSPVLHRERELGRLLDLLSARTIRPVALVGEPGAGRSALLAALAATSADPPLTPAGPLPPGLSPGALLQDLHRRAPPGVPLVLDGCTLVGPETGDGPLQLLATSRAGRRWIITVTPSDLRRFEAGAPELVAALETVSLAALPPESLTDVLEAGLETLVEAAGVGFAIDASSTLLRLSARYPSDRAQPGRALVIAEIAAARAARLGLAHVGEHEIASVVADAAGVPLASLLRSDDERFQNLDVRLAERVVGHDHARTRIADVLRRSYAGFRGQRPVASLLLLGPTGVGKTETARAIADALFDGDVALLRIDLSEYSEAHAVARLIGSPPGYVGHEEGGQLTEAIRRRPASVVLFDELEKAHREVLLLLLQVLEDGRLTDGRGRTVDFTASAIVMTSNLGSDLYRRSRRPSEAAVLAQARRDLPAELWNRIDEILCYTPLAEAELAGIVARLAVASSRRLGEERGITFDLDEDVIQHLLAAEPDRTLGARPLRRAFERLVEGPLAGAILAGDIDRGCHVLVGCDARGRIVIERAAPPVSPARARSNA